MVTNKSHCKSSMSLMTTSNTCLWRQHWHVCLVPTPHVG